jgi:PBP1b-binding outer membrane lipoprotein LpoB
MKRATFILALAMFAVFASGCASAVQSGHNTALDSVDLKSMTDQMAASIAGDPKVQAAIAREGQLRVVVQPVQNEMEAEVLPAGPAEAFTARVRFLLSGHDAKSFQWIMNRDAFYHLRNKEREDVLGPSPDAINPDYALVARFRSLTNENSQGRNSYYLCVYELTDLRDRTVLWSHPYEVEKKAVKGFLD